ncbi:MAG TPA: hypothetical protein DCZ69_19150, partial [Syntrophobacteraceae bacterium]|nr:hypothetical protein [Syntrophobacteraceae bacterium]
MNAASFIYGFLSALVLICLGLAAIYATLRKNRQRQANIKGYLDLIPDLTGNQRAQLQEIRRA